MGVPWAWMRRGRAPWVRYAVMLGTVAALSGCGSLSGWRGGTQEPVRSDRFDLPSEGTDVVGVIQVVIARHEDTLADLARRYGLGFDEIIAANPDVDPWLPGEGTRVVLPTQFVLPDAPRRDLVLNLASLRLFYYPKPAAGEPAVVITHPIGIGREGWRTPQGRMRVIEKLEQPKWTVPASVRKEHAEMGDPLPAVVPPGPDNPLGAFAMRLSRPSYLIHGTNKPHGVGMRVSHGCVRLYPEDIARLFPQISEGTDVRIVNQPYLAGWREGQLYLEAHSPLAEEAKRWNGSLDPMEDAVRGKFTDTPKAVDWDKARRVAREARGIPVPISPRSADTDDVVARARRVPSIPPWVDPQVNEI
jgi:L,D-transpeptidase ErfK/SrfK